MGQNGTSQEFARRFAITQRQRLVGSLLGWCEQHAYPYLPDQVRTQLREKVLASVGAYHDAVLDMLRATVDDGSVVNQRALELLEQIHADARQLVEGMG